MKEIKVLPEFRVNQLSLTPGGSTVTAIKENGTRLSYDNVKNPQAYINTISKKDSSIVSFEVNGSPVEKR